MEITAQSDNSWPTEGGQLNLGLIDAAWWGTELSTHAIFQRTKEIGFTFIDLIVDPLDLTDADRSGLVTASKDVSLPVFSVPCVAFGLTDPFPAVRHFHLERAKRHVELAREVEACLLLAVGEHVWNREVLPEAEVWNHAVEGTREIANYAAQLGIEVVVENEPFPNSIVNTAESMVAFMNDVGLPNVKLCVDLSHLWLLKTPPEGLRIFGDLIGHVHLSDCQGTVHEDLPPGSGTAPLHDYLTEISSLGYRGPIAIELQRPETPGLEARQRWIEDAYQAAVTVLTGLDARQGES